MTALRQPETNGSGPWGKVPLWITTAPISDSAKVLFAFYAATDYDGDGKVYWSLPATDKALHWGMDKAKRARPELSRIKAITVESRPGRTDEIILNFHQPRASVPPLPRASMPYGTDRDTDTRSRTKRTKRKNYSPSKPLGFTDSRGQGTSALGQSRAVQDVRQYEQELASAEDYITRWHPDNPKTGREFTAAQLVEFRRARRAEKESA